MVAIGIFRYADASSTLIGMCVLALCGLFCDCRLMIICFMPTTSSRSWATTIGRSLKVNSFVIYKLFKKLGQRNRMMLPLLPSVTVICHSRGHNSNNGDYSGISSVTSWKSYPPLAGSSIGIISLEHGAFRFFNVL